MKDSTTQLMLFIGAVLILGTIVAFTTDASIFDFIDGHVNRGIPKY